MSMPQNCIYWLHNTITRSLSIAPMLVEIIDDYYSYETGGGYELRVKIIRVESYIDTQAVTNCSIVHGLMFFLSCE